MYLDLVWCRMQLHLGDPQANEWFKRSRNASFPSLKLLCSPCWEQQRRQCHLPLVKKKKKTSKRTLPRPWRLGVYTTSTPSGVRINQSRGCWNAEWILKPELTWKLTVLNLEKIKWIRLSYLYEPQQGIQCQQLHWVLTIFKNFIAVATIVIYTADTINYFLHIDIKHSNIFPWFIWVCCFGDSLTLARLLVGAITWNYRQRTLGTPASVFINTGITSGH